MSIRGPFTSRLDEWAGREVGVEGVCGTCSGRACGVCRACVGRVWCVWGVGCVWHVWGVWGRAWGVCVGQKVLVSLAPLYYPDTLVNPDTCLGSTVSSCEKG